MAESNYVRKKQKRRKRNRNIRILVIILIIVAALFGTEYATGGAISGTVKQMMGVFNPKDVVNTLKNSSQAETTTAVDTTAETTAVSTTAETTTQAETENPNAALVAEADKILNNLTTEQKVDQLFIITPDALTGVSNATQAGDSTKQAISSHPVGGLIYQEGNIQSEEQIRSMTSNTQTYFEDTVGVDAFLCVNEEGGMASVINGSGRIAVDTVPDMSTVTTTKEARQYGKTIGTYLKNLGFNVDFAPMADVLINENNSTIANRSFGSDAATTAKLSVAFERGLQSAGVLAGAKYFPGYGATDSNGSTGSVTSDRTSEELNATELVPYKRLINAGKVSMMMVGHTELRELTGDDTPSCLSEDIVTKLLREELGFNGVVVTDSLSKAAITGRYSSGEAAVMAIQAGCDMLQMPEDFSEAYDAVLSAVNSGEITEERLDESVERILVAKLALKEGTISAGTSTASSDSVAAETSADETAVSGSGEDSDETTASGSGEDSNETTASGTGEKADKTTTAGYSGQTASGESSSAADDSLSEEETLSGDDTLTESESSSES